MATLKQQILDLVSKRAGLTDREVTDRVRGREAAQQPVNQACRQLEAAGMLKRSRRHDGLIGNYPTGREPRPTAPPPDRATADRNGTSTEGLSEDEVKKVLVDWLKRQGWKVTVAWGNDRGPDCVAVKDGDRWIIEVKGCGSRPQMRVNYFLAVLGEVLQRMDDPQARYSIAFPDMYQFRRLWERLPPLAKERIGLTVLFVNDEGHVSVRE